MKKRKIIGVLVLVILLSSSLSLFAQEAPARTKMFGINPLGLIFNIYSGHFGMIIKDGANELNFPFFYWHPADDITILGGGAKYRFYFKKNGKAFFYGGTLSVMSISWDYRTLDENWNWTTETVTGISFTPGAEIGYRWAWDNGFTLAPTIGAGFTIGKIESSTGIEVAYGGQGISWSLGIGLAYMW